MQDTVEINQLTTHKKFKYTRTHQKYLNINKNLILGVKTATEKDTLDVTKARCGDLFTSTIDEFEYGKVEERYKKQTEYIFCHNTPELIKRMKALHDIPDDPLCRIKVGCDPPSNPPSHRNTIQQCPLHGDPCISPSDRDNPQFVDSFYCYELKTSVYA